MSSERELIVTRWLPTTPDALFSAFTDPEKLVRWMGPRSSKLTECAVDARAEGSYRFTLEFDGGVTVTLVGVYRAVQYPDRLAFSWGIEGESTDSEVTVQFEQREGGTQLLLTHRGLSPDELAQNEAGWTELLERLAEILQPS